MTEAEKRYSQLVKKALAIRWACERCYIYDIGSSFVIETDHKPLISLFNNPNSRPPLRFERWLLFLQQFDFTLRYCPGKENAADYFSRQAIPFTTDEEKTCGHRAAIVHQVMMDTVPKSVFLIKEIQKSTKCDPEL